MSNMTVDEEALKEFRTRARTQYNIEPELVAVHPQEKTVSGVFEFEVALRPDKKQYCFFWRFKDDVASGQLGMDVTDTPGASATQVMDQWLALRKLTVKPISAAAKARTAAAANAAAKAAAKTAKPAAKPKAAAKPRAKAVKKA
jgi:bacillopeptidase F (M6 metalloprotease family)